MLIYTVRILFGQRHHFQQKDTLRTSALFLLPLQEIPETDTALFRPNLFLPKKYSIQTGESIMEAKQKYLQLQLS